MEEKYITRLLTFSDENLMRNIETISLSRKNVKELLKEIHTDYIPISVIEKKKEEIKKEQEKIRLDEDCVWNNRIYNLDIAREVLQEILDERNNINE